MPLKIKKPNQTKQLGPLRFLAVDVHKSTKVCYFIIDLVYSNYLSIYLSIYVSIFAYTYLCDKFCIFLSATPSLSLLALRLLMYLKTTISLSIIHVYHIYPTPPLGQDMTQGQFLKRSLTGLNSEFSFS